MKKIEIRKLNVQTMCGNYVCRFESNYPEKGYTVTVPNLRGVVTFGSNLVEAKKMVKEAIELPCQVEPQLVTKSSKKKDHLLRQWA